MGKKGLNPPLPPSEPSRHSGSDCSKLTLVLVYLVRTFASHMTAVFICVQTNNPGDFFLQVHFFSF